MSLPFPDLDVLTSSWSGTLNDTVYSHNQYARYTRPHTFPTQATTGPSLISRAALKAAVARWHEITPSQRLAWVDYARRLPFKNPLGCTIFYTGFIHFVRSFIPRHVTGNTLADNPPTGFSLPTFRILSITVDGSLPSDNIVITYEDAPWVHETRSQLEIFSQNSVPATVNFYKQPFTLFSLINGGAITPPPNPFTMSTPFAYNSGDHLPFQFRLSRADSSLSLLQRFTILAT